MQCTGACCRDFTVVVDGKPISHASWREGGFAEGDLARLAVPAAEEFRFNCTEHDSATGLCRIYETRPRACRSFPFQAIQNGKKSNVCRHCGYTQDKEEFDATAGTQGNVCGKPPGCRGERESQPDQGGAFFTLQR